MVNFPLTPNAPFTLQVVCPAVTSVSRRRNRLQSRPIFVRVVHTTGCVIHSYRHLMKLWGRIHKRDQAQLKLIFGSS